MKYQLKEPKRFTVDVHVPKNERQALGSTLERQPPCSVVNSNSTGSACILLLNPRCSFPSPVVECEALTNPAHGSVECDQSPGSFPWNTSCAFACAEGFELVGPQRLQCASSGNWDDEKPTCAGRAAPGRDLLPIFFFSACP